MEIDIFKYERYSISSTVFSVSGTRQTPIEAKLWKDGKALPAKEVEAVVQQDKVLFKFKKPSREGSGKYTIKLANAQGEDSKDVSIIMQSVPSAPEDVAVSEVFQTSCEVAWKTPQDDGGSPIVKYVIERQVNNIFDTDFWSRWICRIYVMPLISNVRQEPRLFILFLTVGTVLNKISSLPGHVSQGWLGQCGGSASWPAT